MRQPVVFKFKVSPPPEGPWAGAVYSGTVARLCWISLFLVVILVGQFLESKHAQFIDLNRRTRCAPRFHSPIPVRCAREQLYLLSCRLCLFTLDHVSLIHLSASDMSMNGICLSRDATHRERLSLRTVRSSSITRTNVMQLVALNRPRLVGLTSSGRGKGDSFERFYARFFADKR